LSQAAAEVAAVFQHIPMVAVVVLEVIAVLFLEKTLVEVQQ
jgi:hypothetical protein